MPPIPLHEKKRKNLLKAVCISTCITATLAAILALLQFPVNVVLPTSAPVWAGLSSMLS